MLSIYQYTTSAPRFKEGRREISRSLRDEQQEREESGRGPSFEAKKDSVRKSGVSPLQAGPRK